ncbi:UNVERIFIED_CONTAM: 1-phosphatidylinositol 4,5-bisphosphate phosphodiesterase delta-4 [Siphonaria sp. JEL0065]|nr:1-phosphatidylinositol 4,5-bisphosphate phosphodiesterase delta-4 [Siphonaria sp. JEL0065]
MDTIELLPTAPPRSPSPSPSIVSTTEVLALEQRLAQGTLMLKYPNKASRRPEERTVRVVGAGVGWDSKKRKEANFLNIREIRLGQNTRAFELHGKTADVEERAFSIIYVAEGKYKMLNLVAPTKEECAIWVAGLHMLLANTSVIVDTPTTALIASPIPVTVNSWLERLWNDADPNNLGKLGLDSVTALMGRLNLRLSKQEVKSALKNSGITKHSFLVFEDFERLYRTLRFRPEIGELFSSLAKTDPSGLTFQEFEDFMINVQKMRFNSDRGNRTNRILFRDVVDAISRFAFVASEYPLILSLETHCSMDQQAAMARILVEVLGDALVTEPYLKRGSIPLVLPSPIDLKWRILIKGKTKPMNPDLARMVSSDEIDDESEDDLSGSANLQAMSPQQPQTSTSVSTSPTGRSAYYTTAEVSPLSLDSAEHFPELQKRVGEEAFVRRVSSALNMNTSISSSASASSNIDGGKRVSLKKITSNTRLADRAAIKKRYIVEKSLMDLVVYCKAVRFTGMEMLESRFLNLISKPGATSSIPPSPTLKSPLSMYSTSPPISTTTSPASNSTVSAPATTLSPPLSRKSTLSQPIQQQQVHQSPESLHWKSHHSKNLTRIYPSPLRISSSNPENPCLFWAVGVQMVALNYQTFDRGMQINSAVFKGNGGCGYVLKSGLRDWKWRWRLDEGWMFGRGKVGHEEGSGGVLEEESGFCRERLVDSPVNVVDCVSEHGAKGEATAVPLLHASIAQKTMVLSVRVISGQQLPSSKEGGGIAGRLIHSPPCVEIEIVGNEVDCIKFKTRASSSGGFNALWKEEFQLHVLDPELAVLRFQVISSENRLTNDVIGRYAIALDNIELGYRHVPLLNRNGEKTRREVQKKLPKKSGQIMASKVEVCPSDRSSCASCSKSIRKGAIRFGFCEPGVSFNVFSFECLSCVTKQQVINAESQHGSVEKIPGFKLLDRAGQLAVTKKFRPYMTPPKVVSKPTQTSKKVVKKVASIPTPTSKPKAESKAPNGSGLKKKVTFDKKLVKPYVVPTKRSARASLRRTTKV